MVQLAKQRGIVVSLIRQRASHVCTNSEIDLFYVTNYDVRLTCANCPSMVIKHPRLQMHEAYCVKIGVPTNRVTALKAVRHQR